MLTRRFPLSSAPMLSYPSSASDSSSCSSSTSHLASPQVGIHLYYCKLTVCVCVLWILYNTSLSVTCSITHLKFRSGFFCLWISWIADIWRFDTRVQNTLRPLEQRCSAATETTCFSHPVKHSQWTVCLFALSQHSDGELNQIQLKEEADMVCDDGRSTPADLEEYVMVPAHFPSKHLGIIWMHECPEQQHSDRFYLVVF